jgi:hypothetical protein
MRQWVSTAREQATEGKPAVGNDSAYWDWRNEQLKATAWAVGGEPCQVCEQPVPAGAHWTHRDRHVCSPRCNLILGRRLKRMIDRGELTPPPAFTPDPQPLREACWFATAGPQAPLPYEVHGYSPKPGDAVERHGSVTVYSRLADLPDGAAPWQVTAGDWDPSE